jgi:carbamate kinase
MTADNFDKTLAAFRQRSPYRPFTVVLHSGSRFEVDHLGALVARDGVAVFVGPGGLPVVFDHEGVEQFVGDLSGQPTE